MCANPSPSMGLSFSLYVRVQESTESQNQNDVNRVVRQEKNLWNTNDEIKYVGSQLISPWRKVHR